jgi:polysaccharide pyruvyl transferase WcaK-like protein
MKQVIISQSLKTYNQALHLWRNLGLIHIQESSALVLPPSSPGNLGDEALVTSTINYLKDKEIKYIGLISYKKGSQWRSLDSDSIEEIIEMEEYFRCSTNRNFWKALFQVIPKISQYERFYCLGADVMDGHYSDKRTFARLKLTSVAAEIGLESTICGFSFNDKPTPRSVQTFRNLPSKVKLCTRDSISQARLISQINRPVKLVADLAFLLSPTPESKIASQVLQWIDKQRANNRVIIGFTPYNKLNKELGIDKINQLIQIYVEHLTTLYSQRDNFSFMLLPHDFRDASNKVSDLVLAEKILNNLPPEIKSHSIKVPTPCTAADIKAIVGNLDFVLSGKFHVAIACLGQATPVAGITVIVPRDNEN